ncbi:LOW QUALITY PROTEIN: protein mono-ADP-ribosyltransferase PARP14-like [Haliotis rubra]|uniref:LOW QUALITY PROTEIN: protein mono-ADP-ribosyltransferase PARP14-like n=1 Tax=Haliotis rubra TaxID=36100 RepID=UPI001EE59686|nr:LOW QUALITY PROTEIN: protein mono-ADP-ribosyltransferase PARP14-like [Haliotis rubra]
MKKRKNKALVFFKDPEIADRVLNKKPHLINKHSVEVLAYIEHSGAADDDDESGEDDDIQEQSTIEVRGFKPNTSRDTLEYYFENTKRSGGGPVTNSEKKDDVIFITFESPEVVQNVLERKHVVDGANLTVKLHRPTPCYKNRFLVTNISNTTSKDNLMLFLEARARGNVTEVLYGDVPGNALVTFEDDNIPDFEKLQLQCGKRPLDGQHLQVKKVPISDSVIVRGLKKESTGETLQFYFENKKSGNTDGIPVTVSTHKDEGYCIVKFEDYKAIDKILPKQHTVDGAKLTVQLYVERLGLGIEDTDGSWYKQPQPFTVENLDKPKCRFLQSSRTDKDKLKQSLKERHADITWLSDYSATMTCTLNKDAKDAVKLAQSWRQDTEKFLRAFVDRFQTEEYTTLDQIWEDVRKDLSKMPEAKSVLMDLCDEDHKVIVVGHSTDVQKVGTKVKKTIQGVENEFQRKQKEVTERITNLKPLQLQLLVMDGYVADMKKRYSTDLKVTVNAEQTEMIFKGQVNEINDCKVSMYERIASYNSQRLTLSQRLVSFLDKRDVKDMVMNKLRDMKITGVWDIDSKTKTVIVMATTEENAAFLGRKLKDMIVEHHEKIDRENAFLLSSDKLAAFEKATLERYDSLVSLYTDRQASQVVVVAFDNTIDKIREELNNFIQQNSVYRQIVKLPGPVYRFLLANGDRELMEISHDLAKHNGKLDKSTAPQITVSGCQEVLTKAVQGLMSLAKKVIHKKYTLKKPGISKFINSEDGKSVIGSTEKDTRCIIELSFDESVKVRVETIGSMPASVTSVPHGRSGTRVLATCDIDSNRRIHVVIGDITAMEVDVIVNAANNRLDHIGGLAKAIANKGGPTIQKESDAYTAKNKTLRAGDVVTTGSGRLPCKMVAHAVGPCWSGGHRGEEGDLKDAIMLSLEQTDRNGYKSIALPALSAGIFGYPVKLATRHIVEAIKKFFTLESPNSDVTNVYMIDTNEGTTKLFTVALQEVYSDRRVTLTESTNRPDMRPPLAKKPKPVAGGVRVLPTQGSNTSSRCKVTIVKGEIAKQKVDVVVNSANNSLDLSNGAVSKSILKAAGNTIQQELLAKYPQGIQTGDVAVSSGGNLGCRVYHVCLSPASASGSDVLQNIIMKCLQTAADEGCRMIAFPALGAGNLGYAANFVAQTMYTAVNNFQKKNTSLKEVLVVIYPTDKKVIQAFEEYERRLQTGEITDPPVVAYESRSFLEEESVEDSWISQVKHDGLHIGRLGIQIKQGDITKEDADCIINSTNPELDLNRGAVSKAIATACGKDMTSQCKMKLEAMRQNGVVSTTAKGLKCKYVLHVAGDHFGNDWKKVVLICLREADKLGDAQSVAFPVLGTGAGHVNPQEISKIMVQAFAEFEPEASNLADIQVVVFQQPMFLTVSSEIQKSVNSMNQGTSRRTSKIGTTAPGSVELYFFSDHSDTIADGIKKLEARCQKEWRTKKLDDQVIPKLTDQQIQSLHQKFDVELKLDRNKGVIQLTGQGSMVDQAYIKVIESLRNIEKEESETERASLLSQTIQWAYFEKDKTVNMKDFDTKENAEIEKAYRANKKSCKVKVQKTTIDIDFSSMEGKEKKKTYNIIRRDLMQEAKQSIFDPPQNWQPMADDDNVQSFPVAAEEFKMVAELFMKTVNNSNATVLKVDRIQNRSLYQQYTAKKKQLEKQNPQGTQNESWLWHGTSTDAIDSINAHGFNRSYCGKNATVYGQGVYFAVNAEYSAQNTYSRPDPQGQKYMYLVRVLTGEYTKGTGDMRVPPSKAGSTVLFDSVVNDINNPAMYVVFNDTQAYPDYLVTFHP